MNIFMTGTSGLVGSALVPWLKQAGHQVEPLRRMSAKTIDGPGWDPQSGRVGLGQNPGKVDALVHLAGENIAGRWTGAKKARIRESRVEATQRLSQEIVRRVRPLPKVFVCASAVHYYGDQGGHWVDEDSPPGKGFLADVVLDWEGATKPLADAGVRVVFLRFGMILSPDGGALKQMLPAFRLGLGGRIGHGRQYWSWVTLTDVVRIVQSVIEESQFSGPVNVVAPGAVTSAEFAQELGRVLRRPTKLPLPGWVARIALGAMANELLLSSTRVYPQRLKQNGYSFQYPELSGALESMLSRQRG